jgi:hypothetical protein
VYAHPTISEMASAIASSVNSKGGATVSDPTDAIHAMIEEYSRDLPKVAPLDTPRPEDQVVLITGSTRGLGSELLSSFILNDKVKKVYALNRPSGEKTSLARHQETFDDRYASFAQTMIMSQSRTQKPEPRGVIVAKAGAPRGGDRKGAPRPPCRSI